MSKSFDLIVKESKEGLINFINQSGLPLSVIDMILVEISSTVKVQLNNNLQGEIHMEQEEK